MTGPSHPVGPTHDDDDDTAPTGRFFTRQETDAIEEAVAAIQRRNQEEGLDDSVHERDVS